MKIDRAYIPQDIRSLGLLALSLALGLALGACRAETPPVIGDTPIVVTEAPTVEAEPLAYPPPPTDTPAGYPPPGGSFVPPTPRPTFTPLPPTPTPWSVADLPPLPTYAPPGPFSGMRLLYFKGGYRTIKVDGADEIMWEDSSPQKYYLHISPDGGKVLYTIWENRRLDATSIWTMNPDESDKQLLVQATDGWYPWNAIWSPDGKQIAFLGVIEGEDHELHSQELWVMDADGSNQRLVLSDPYLLESPSFYSFFWALNGYIYLPRYDGPLNAINPNDGSFFRLADNVDAMDLMFSLATDGIHAASRGELSAPMLQSAGFSTTEVSGMVYGWSADGTRLVFRNDQGIWIHDVITNKDQLVLPSSSPSYYYNITVYGISPDGRYIACRTNEGLLVIDVENPGEAPSLVVSGEHSVSFIAWVPIP